MSGSSLFVSLDQMIIYGRTKGGRRLGHHLCSHPKIVTEVFFDVDEIETLPHLTYHAVLNIDVCLR